MADFAISRISDDLHRMRELAVQSANSTYGAQERGDMEIEFQQLRDDINYVTQNADFNGYFLLRGGAPSGWTNSTTGVSNTIGGPSNSFNVTPQAQTFGVGASGPFTLTGVPATYNLGAGGPQSIVVTATDSVTGVTRTIPYDATNTNGFNYSGGSNQISLSGTGLASPTEKISVRYIPAGSTTFSLSGTPVPGSEVVTANGAGVPNAGSPAGNGYYISGNTLSLVGSALPDASSGPVTVAASYLTGSNYNTLPLNTETTFFQGGILNPALPTVTVDGVSIANDPVNGYSLVQTPVEDVGGTTLYSYEIQLNGTSQITGAGPHTFTANYSFDYPTGVDPLTFQVQDGANQGQTEDLVINRLTVGGLGLGNAHVNTQTGATAVLNALNGSLDTMTTMRAHIGGYESSMEHMYNNALTMSESQGAAESHIRDADMAQTITDVSRAEIMQNAATGVFQDLRANSSYLLKLLTG